MQGRRLRNGTEWSRKLPAGAYWLTDGHWYIITPNGLFGDVTKHEVTVHQDGTITVSPSIRVTAFVGEERRPLAEWHGYLERGVWKECQ